MTRTTGRLGLVGLALFLPTFLVGFDAAAPLLAGPGSGRPATRLLMLGAYLLSGVASILLWRMLVTGIGRERAFVAAVLVFLAGSALCGASQSTAQLAASRVVQGVGAGGVLPLALSILGNVFPQPARTRVTSLLSSAWGVSTLGGPTVGGVLSAHLPWQLIFLANLPLGVISVLLLAWWSERRAGLPPSPALTARSGVRRRPLRQFSACGATAGLAGAALFVIAFVVPVSDGRPVLAGLPLAGAWLSWTAGSLIGAQLARRRGSRVPVTVGVGLAAAGSTLHILPVAGGPWTFAGWALFSAGLGIAQAAGISTALAAASSARVMAAAGQHLARIATGTLSVALALALLAAGAPARDTPFLLSAAASAVALLVATRLPPPTSPQHTLPPETT